MSTSNKRDEVLIRSVRFSTSDGVERLVAGLVDGREVAVPLFLFPILKSATARQRKNWRLVAGGVGVRWPDLDVDLSAEGLVEGRADVTKAARRALSKSDQLSYLLALLAQRRGGVRVADMAELLSSTYSSTQIRALVDSLNAATPRKQHLRRA